MLSNIVPKKFLQFSKTGAFGARTGPYNPYMYKDHFIPRQEPKYFLSPFPNF
jgi:hypothetical protein